MRRPSQGPVFFEISRFRFRRKRNLEISASRVSAGREDGRLETSVSYCLIPPRSSILSEFLRFRRKVEGGDNRILAGAPGRAVPAASSVLPSLFAAQLVLCCWVDGTQDAGPSARKRRRANPALPSAAFRDMSGFEAFRRFRILRDLVRQTSPRWSLPGRPDSCRVGGGQGAMPSARERRRANPVLVSAGFRDCADFEIVRRFRILRDLVRPNPPTQLDIVRDFEISTKSYS